MISQLFLSTMLALAAAQSPTTLSIPGPEGDSDMIAASVVSANSAATTLALFCVEPGCGLFPAQTLVYGPKTFNMDMSDPTPGDDFTATQDCVVEASTAVCKESAAGSEANFPGSSTTTYDTVGVYKVTVTAGAEKLTQSGEAGASSSAASKTAAGSASSSAQTASVTPAPGLGSAAASASVSRTGSVAAPASTGGAAINAMVFGGGFVGAAAGVFGGLLL